MYRRSRSRHTLSSCPWAERRDLVLWVFWWARLAASRDLRPFIPITGFISKGRNHPFEQISRNQHHHGKVLFTVPSCSPDWSQTAHMSGQCSSRTNLFPGFNRTLLPVSQLSKKEKPLSHAGKAVLICFTGNPDALCIHLDSP